MKKDHRYGSPSARRRADEAAYARRLAAGIVHVTVRMTPDHLTRLGMAARAGESRAATATRAIHEWLDGDVAVAAAAERLLSALSPLTQEWVESMEHPEILNAISELEMALNSRRER